MARRRLSAVMRSDRMPKPPGDPDPFRSPGQRLAGPGRCPRRPCHLISSPVHMLSITSDDREIFRLAIPALGALAAEPLVALVDTAFVGRLGEAPLAALGVVTGLLGLVFFVFIALAYASTPLIARAMGAGDRDRAAVLAGQSMLIAVVLVVIGLVVFETAAPQLVRLMGSAPEVEHLAVGYLRLRGLGLPALLAITVGHAVYRGLGDTRTPMFISLGLSLINVVLDPVLIFGFGWGLAGAGIATVIAQSAGAAAFMYLLFTGRTGLEIRWTAPSWVNMRELIGAGSALFVRTLALVTTFTVATASAARLGVTEVAAHQVAIQVWFFLSLVVDSIAIAAQNLVAAHLRTDPSRARRLSNRMLAWSFSWGVLMAVVFWVLRNALPGWFTPDPAVIAMAASLMPFVAITQPLNSVVFVLDGIMIGAADFTFLAAAMVGANGLACTLLLTAGSISGIWWVLVILMLARVGPITWRYVRVVI